MAAQIPIVARGLKPPHEELKNLEECFKEIRRKPAPEKVGDTEATVYEGQLNDVGVRRLLPGSVDKLIGKGTYEGTASVWVGREGRVLRFAMDCRIQVEHDDATAEISVKRTTEFADVGKATVDIPAELKKLLK